MRDHDFWDNAERVEEFADRDPDHRLTELLKTYSERERTRVLDLGCAGGRNTAPLVQAGFDFWALDSSAPMVAKTRERVAAVVGWEAATERVRLGVMEDLSAFPRSSFDLVVALGVYHQASSRTQWLRALAETHWVLVPGGLVLTSTFSPRSRPNGVPLRALDNKAHLYEGFSSGPLFLLEADEFDADMTSLGFMVAAGTGTAVVSTDGGYRVTVNGLYRKGP